MSSFRIFILVLLTLAVGGMFFIISKSQSDMEAEYNAYLVSKRSDEVTSQAPGTQVNVSVGDEATGADEEGDSDDSRIARKREEQRKAKKEQEEAQFREQERRTLEEQARREQALRDKAAREEKEEKIAPIGRVYSFDEFEACLTMEPLTQQPLTQGLNVMVMRNGRAIAEATIDSKDESGLYFAYVKDVVISSKKKDVNPQQGDQVVIVDLPSAQDLRSGYNAPVSLFPDDDEDDDPAAQTAPTPAPAPAPAAGKKPAPAPAPAAAEEPAPINPADLDPTTADGEEELPSLPEVDATLTPVP